MKNGPWPLGLLHIPVGATPWSDNTYIPLSLDAFVQKFYVKSSWTDEEGDDTARGFVSGAIEGWINSDGTQQSIAIVRFASSVGADSMFGDLGSSFQEEPKPAKFLTDLPVGAVGCIDPTLDADGNARVEMVTRTGDLLIDVHEFSAAKPDVAAAQALLLQQYQSLTGH
jgi:hypothetical protein